MSAETETKTETEPENEDESESKTVDTAIAIAIAVVSLVAALLAAMAVTDSGAASGALEDVIFATVNREKADVIAHTWMFQDLRAFVQHERLVSLVESTEAAAGAAEARGEKTLAKSLRDQAKALQISAESAADFYSAEYVQADGSFDETAFLEQQMRFEARNHDINPDDDLAAARVYFTRSSSYIISVAGMGVSITFFILAQIAVNPKLRWWWFWAGAGMFVLTLIYTFFAAWSRSL